LVGGSEGGWQENLGLRPHWSEVVRSLERLLDAANARLILLVEDSDRHDKAFDPHHIARLLDELRKSRNITYVLAIDDAVSGIDVGKACDHLFQIPSPDEDLVRAVLGAVRTHALKASFVDPLGDKRNEILTMSLPTDPLSEAVRREFGGGVVDALTQLLSTPRQAKHMARATVRTWSQLAGEVDLDDLIVLMVLRECEPAIFKFLYDNRHEVKRSKRRVRLSNDQKSDEFKEEWTRVIASSKNRNAIEQIVEFLQFEHLTSFRVGDTRPQGVGRDESSVDYFRRIFEEKLHSSEVPDQLVLRVIDGYEAGNREDLLSRLVEQHERGRGFLGAWEDLSDRHKASSLLEITSELLERLRQKDGARAIGDQEAVLSLWRRANRRIGATDERDAWISEELRKAVRVSLDQANDLYYYWASVNQGSVSIPGRAAARTAMLQELKAVATDSDTLAATMSETNPWALARLRFPSDQTEQLAASTEPSDWSWLTPALIKLLENGKPHVAEQVARFVGRGARDNDSSRLEVDEQLLRAIAAERLEDLLAAFVNNKNKLLKTPRFVQQVEALHQLRTQGNR